MKPHVNCMIAQGPADPATVRCRYCRQIKVACESVVDGRCCADCTHGGTQ